MIDIHSHVLPFVDDGSGSYETSLAMLKTARAQGVTDMILTPHFISGEYEAEVDELKEKFSAFVERVKNAGIDVNLYLGQEIFIRKGYKKLFEAKDVLTMNETNFVLIEFDTGLDYDIAETVYELKRMGYIPVIAHFERYSYADLSVADEIKSLGGYIQINAEALVGKHKHKYYKRIKGLLKEGLVDFVASDVHDFRGNLLLKSYEFVCKKFGTEYANKLYKENARKIIGG